METFKVVETFVSINGEGKKAGRLAMFIRLKGCNLNCSYCDTTWANKRDARCELLTAPQIVERIKEAGVELVTLTGGEPLLDEKCVRIDRKYLDDAKKLRLRLRQMEVYRSDIIKKETTD